jgi:hypothetical protein
VNFHIFGVKSMASDIVGQQKIELYPKVACRT